MKSGCLVGLLQSMVNRDKLKFYWVKGTTGQGSPQHCGQPFSNAETSLMCRSIEWLRSRHPFPRPLWLPTAVLLYGFTSSMLHYSTASAKWLVFDPSQHLHQPKGFWSSQLKSRYPKKTRSISDYRIHPPITEILLISIQPCKMQRLSGL